MASSNRRIAVALAAVVTGTLLIAYVFYGTSLVPTRKIVQSGDCPKPEACACPQCPAPTKCETCKEPTPCATCPERQCPAPNCPPQPPCPECPKGTSFLPATPRRRGAIPPPGLKRYGPPSCDQPPCYMTYALVDVGRMNNQRVALRNALVVAYVLNRTLVVPHWLDGAAPGEYVDMEEMGEAVPVLSPDDFARVGGHRMSTRNVGGEGEILNLRTQARTAGPQRLYDAFRGYRERVFAFPRMFSWRVDDAEGADVYLFTASHMRNARWVREEAARYVTEELSAPFLAYHSRHLEGECAGRARKFGLPATACEHSPEEVAQYFANLTARHHFQPASFFLGTDGQRPAVDSAMVSRVGFRTYPRARLPPQHQQQEPAHGLVDHEIMCQAQFFVGPWFSTLTVTVAQYRRGVGLWSEYFEADLVRARGLPGRRRRCSDDTTLPNGTADAAAAGPLWSPELLSLDDND